MSRSFRKTIFAIVVLIIIGNTWFLWKKHLVFDPTAVESPPSGATASKESKPPIFYTPKEKKPQKNGLPVDKSFSAVETKASLPKSAQTALKNPHSNAEAPIAENERSTPAYRAGMKEIRAVLDKISAIKPNVAKLETFNRQIEQDLGPLENGELPATSTVLGLYLQLSDAQKAALKLSHAQMMRELPSTVVNNAFSGRGIVMTGGGKYFPMVLTAIWWLRQVDKETPVEVFMSDSTEYEAHICDGLFPKLNVECRVVRDIYGEALAAKLESKYALKPLAILASKFDDIYFMDADSYPRTNVNKVFDWEVFDNTGLILNADYWPRYISPSFYEIVGIKLGPRVSGLEQSDAILQSDRENAVPGKSTESGQIFVRKSAHIKSLMLAMYYNLYGPDVYFPLLMQGGPGEGDKDTYAAAAVICGEKYYQTQRRPITLGQHLSNGGYRGYAMVQPDPISDYQRHEEQQDVKEQFFALHANSIKSNPHYLLSGYKEPIRGAPPLQQMRYFGDMKNVEHELQEPHDIEKQLFEAMLGVACQWAAKDNYVPRDWEGEDPQRYCDILHAHIEWLKSHPDIEYDEGAAFYIDLAKQNQIKPYLTYPN